MRRVLVIATALVLSIATVSAQGQQKVQQAEKVKIQQTDKSASLANKQGQVKQVRKGDFRKKRLTAQQAKFQQQKGRKQFMKMIPRDQKTQRKDCKNMQQHACHHHGPQGHHHHGHHHHGQAFAHAHHGHHPHFAHARK